MIRKLLTTAVAASGLAVAAPALAATATFTGPTTGCPACVTVDASGMTASALGHQLPTGWDVTSGANSLYLANRTGAAFTIPNATFPGKTFDLTGLKLFAYGYVLGPVTLTLYAFHFGNPVADTVQLTVNTRAVQTLTLNDPRLTGVDTLVLRSDALAVKYMYVIGMTFTPH